MRGGAGLALLFALCALAAPAGGQEPLPVPPLSGPVVDQAGVLGAGERSALAALAQELEQKTGAEMALLTIRSTLPEDVFDYGLRVAEAWQLGKKGKDNGLLFVVAVEDRKLHIFTGYGLEGILPDGRVGAIRDTYLIPRFRQGDYAGGILLGMRAAAEIIAADAGVVLSGRPLARPRQGSGRPRGTSPLLLLLPLFLLPGLLLRRRRGLFYAPVFFGGGLGRGGFGGGFGGGRGFGGGGFGGGGFGGGGAGGSW